MPQNPTPAAAGDTNPTTAHDALLQKGLTVYEIAVVLDMHRADVLTEAADLLTEIGTPITGERSEHERGLMYGADRLRRMVDAAKAPSAPSQREVGAL
ncbi:hypothetical protein AB0O08_16050 [Streptomyces anulatus]|uniref:hypothetical protein n=1 Tax=Streptomyces anulatus TaxID=1892 RepID=UPI00342E5266